MIKSEVSLCFINGQSIKEGGALFSELLQGPSCLKVLVHLNKFLRDGKCFTVFNNLENPFCFTGFRD